jgi:hypothetical protein
MREVFFQVFTNKQYKVLKCIFRLHARYSNNNSCLGLGAGLAGNFKIALLIE